MKAVIDADYIRYAVASAGEKRSILVTHKASGRQKEFDTRTDFWGNWRTKDGGYLATINEGRTSPFTWDEFEIEDVQTPEPIENVLHSAKLMFENSYKQAGCSSYIAFFGKGDSFRKELSTLLEYKGNRNDLTKPLLMDEVTEYLIKKYKVNVVENIEADDACVMEAHGKKNRVVIAVDKDTGGNSVNWYNPNNPSKGIVDCSGFGQLWLNEKGEVKGIGRLFLYFQVAFSDKIDNYAANCFSDKRWGEKSAYKALVDCKNDKEALEAVVNIYKALYPEPKIITGWRGDELEIDWKYIASENWHMARMLRSMAELENKVEFLDTLERVGVTYE